MLDFLDLSNFILIWWQWTKPLCLHLLEWHLWLCQSSEAGKPHIFRPPRGWSPSGLKGRKPCQDFLWESSQNLRCHFWHTEVWWAVGRKESKKSGGRDQREYSIVLFVPSEPSESLLRWNGRLGPKYTVKISKAPMRHAENLEHKSPLKGNHSRKRFSGANSVGSKIFGNNARWSPKSSVVRPQLGTWQWLFTNSRSKKMRSKFSCRSLGYAVTLFDKSRRERYFLIDFESSMSIISGMGLSSWESESLMRFRTTISVVTANVEVQTNEEAQVYVHDLHIFVTVELVENSSAFMFFGRLCNEHGYTCERSRT